MRDDSTNGMNRRSLIVTGRAAEAAATLTTGAGHAERSTRKTGRAPTTTASPAMTIGAWTTTTT
jgi:hypothetical protein